MPTFQFEGEQVVVEGGRQPTCGGVAEAAIRPIAAGVLVLRGMAGVATGWRAQENIVLVAILTRHPEVQPY